MRATPRMQAYGPQRVPGNGFMPPVAGSVRPPPTAHAGQLSPRQSNASFERPKPFTFSFTLQQLRGEAGAQDTARRYNSGGADLDSPWQQEQAFGRPAPLMPADPVQHSRGETGNASTRGQHLAPWHLEGTTPKRLADTHEERLDNFKRLRQEETMPERWARFERVWKEPKVPESEWEWGGRADGKQEDGFKDEDA